MSELLMFGCTKADLVEAFDTALGPKALVCMSMLSDVQELLQSVAGEDVSLEVLKARLERARQEINRAKYGISEFWLSPEFDPAPVRVSYSAIEWELYDSQPEASRAATALNHAFNELTRTAFRKMADGHPMADAVAEVYAGMGKTMALHSAAGASDTEPYEILSNLLRRTFSAA